MENTILVTGGCGFIGSNFVLYWLREEKTPVLNLDKLTYAGNLRNLETITSQKRYEFVHADVADCSLVRGLLEHQQPRAVVHFAAESHVDRSISGPDAFVRTNVDGTFALLEEVRTYWGGLGGQDRVHDRKGRRSERFVESARHGRSYAASGHYFPDRRCSLRRNGYD